MSAANVGATLPAEPAALARVLPAYSQPGERFTEDPPDQTERLRIREDLERNFLVEAGAGSGKTTSLVDRMVALVRSRACKVEEIAAVTFTRMAAAELRQRFQVELEREAARHDPDDPRRQLLEEAIQGIDRAFLGTIHSFCAKLLRERPLEAGLDPGFREVQETEAYRAQQKSWTDFLERLAAAEDPRLRQLNELGIPPALLQEAFNQLVENPDVDFVHDPAEQPDPGGVAGLRTAFDGLLDRASQLMRGRQPADGWDSLGKRVRTLLYWRRSLDWEDPSVLFDAVAKVHGVKTKPIQKRWSDIASGKLEAKTLGEDIKRFGEADGRADTLLKSWWAYRYPVALGVAKAAADTYARERKARGEVTFQDLLVLSAELLRNNAHARRALGKRYRRVLVDEFQDTDPLQAEILLLLASDPDAHGNDWRDVVPRPGALFVVGDPKQSIYRFRRADISLYEFVKRRFEAFGEVLHLESNFRSLEDFGDLVKGVFDRKSCFPKEDSDRQASFAPLLARTKGLGLLATYQVGGKRQDEIAADDAARIASEIARRVATGERQPGDFMILTRTRKFLSVYARALEDRNLPVEVSGTGVGFEDELRAFLLLFRCLADPQHKVRVLAALTGPFFGLTLDRIVRYRDNRGSLAIDFEPEGDCEVAQAIGVLHKWWQLARREPADVTAERLVDEIGLFPFAAAGALGEMRAGALVYLLDAVRARSLAGDSSLAGAVDAMETALDWDDAEAPLIPGRPNCVRVMNLHRAKGLEADVVFLAAPFGVYDWPPTMHVSREEGAQPRGTIPIVVSRGFRKEIIAQPLDWEESRKTEAEFEKAEQVRLLYVAATRAKHELWIARGRGLPRVVKPSPWNALEDWVATKAERDEGGETTHNCAVVVALPIDPPPLPDRLEPSTDLAAPVAAAVAGVAGNREATYRLETVTARAKGGEAVAAPGADEADQEIRTDEFVPTPLQPETGGYEWGSVVHDVLAAASEGTHGDTLARYARDLLVENGRPVDATGAPTELDAVLALVESVRGSDIWARAMASSERHSEIPFAVSRNGASGRPEVLEGVIDLVFKDEDHWVVADYKTDSGNDPGFVERLGQYRAQVDLYAECWEQLTGEDVGERVLVFTAQGRTESW